MSFLFFRISGIICFSVEPAGHCLWINRWNQHVMSCQSGSLAGSNVMASESLLRARQVLMVKENEKRVPVT